MTIYISLTDDADDGAPWVYESEELKLVRFGVQIVRVYGPASVTLWEKDGFEDWVKRDVDMSAQQKLASIAAVSQDFIQMESELYGLPAREETPENRGGFTTSIFDASMEGEDNTRTGRFCQQQTEKAFPLVSYRVKLDFFGEQFVRTYVMPGNQGPASGNQVEKIGRKTHTIRETLQFKASTEERIRYWYGDPEIRILEWSEKFVDIDGNELADDKKPNNLKRGETYNTPRGTRGPVFYSDVPCFGSIVVEYEAGYTEYQVLYDFPEPKRVFDITAGNIQKTGFITKDVGGEIVEWDTDLREESGIGGLLDQEIEVEGKNNIVQPIVRHVKLSDGTNKNPNTGTVIPKGEPLVSSDGLVDVDYDTEPCDYDKENDNPPCRKVALRLFFRLNFKPFRVTPLTLVATNGRQCDTVTFTPPEPNFSDAPQNELPKTSFFESRVRERVYPDGAGSAKFLEADHVAEFRNVDIHGNVSTQTLQRGSG